MTHVTSKQYADDVSLLMVLIDTNPLFWSSTAAPFFVLQVPISRLFWDSKWRWRLPDGYSSDQ
ncbi:hypothetical protein HanXRQr2_Chr09g0413231 [Helianthus annuus]|uniref:Uncharacterized protein n=1 Tax=Helianthus annuus TaxID=4232 RepID=A0A251U150_HELAN|nr:hypothetical protein HanXRQr2_Chr09g0413231 [Helianthus annuus]